MFKSRNGFYEIKKKIKPVESEKLKICVDCENLKSD